MPCSEYQAIANTGIYLHLGCSIGQFPPIPKDLQMHQGRIALSSSLLNKQGHVIACLQWYNRQAEDRPLKLKVNPRVFQDWLFSWYKMNWACSVYNVNCYSV